MTKLLLAIIFVLAIGCASPHPLVRTTHIGNRTLVCIRHDTWWGDKYDCQWVAPNRSDNP